MMNILFVMSLETVTFRSKQCVCLTFQTFLYNIYSITKSHQKHQNILMSLQILGFKILSEHRESDSYMTLLFC